jgi:hypothetical protein
MVQLGSEEDVLTLLRRIGEDGVAWPEFLDPVTNEPLKICGYSEDKKFLSVTLLYVPRDVEDETVRGVSEKASFEQNRHGAYKGKRERI